MIVLLQKKIYIFFQVDRINNKTDVMIKRGGGRENVNIRNDNNYVPYYKKCL